MALTEHLDDGVFGGLSPGERTAARAPGLDLEAIVEGAQSPAERVLAARPYETVDNDF
jgi:hypothetical protein